VWLPEGEKKLKICLLVLTEYTSVTDRQTDGQIDTDGYFTTAYAALSVEQTRTRNALNQNSNHAPQNELKLKLTSSSL